MDGQVSAAGWKSGGWTKGWREGETEGWMGEYGWADRQMNMWVDRWMCRWTDGWVDG